MVLYPSRAAPLFNEDPVIRRDRALDLVVNPSHVPPGAILTPRVRCPNHGDSVSIRRRGTVS